MTANSQNSWTGAAGEIRSLYRLGDYATERGTLPLASPHRARKLPLPMRVEMFWRREGFAARVPMNLTIIRRLNFPLDRSALREAVAALIRRHEPLRSMLCVADSIPCQLVCEDFDAAFSTVDLSGLAAEAAAAEESRLVIAFSQQALDLLGGPTFRVQLLCLGGSNHVLSLLLHHYFGDAKSMQIVFSDLMSLYSTIAAERKSELPELGWQYLDYSLWQRNFADTHLEKYLGHWDARLEGSSALGLSPDGAADNKRTAMTSFRIPEDLTSELEILAAGAKTSSFAVLLAAYQYALARWAGKQDVLTAIPVAARLRPDFANIVGYILNAVPIRTRVPEGKDIADIIGGFRQSLMMEYFHQDISYEILEGFLRGPKPLCTTMFNFIPRAYYGQQSDYAEGQIVEFSSPAYEVALRARPRVRIVKDFIIYLGEASGGMEAFLMYNPDFFDPGRIEIFADIFQEQLRSLAKTG